jgi:hypothetical protein
VHLIRFALTDLDLDEGGLAVLRITDLVKSGCS